MTDPPRPDMQALDSFPQLKAVRPIGKVSA